MISQELRNRFLQYFKNKGHTLFPSSSVVPYNDPTLLFTNAGMNQFKEIFLDKGVHDDKTATSSQKCIRVGGKHNDLENVGHTNRHLTFFEMLGNFSFGEYFKKEAIAYAWEVSLGIFDYNPKNLWATVFNEDVESFELWKSYLPELRIIPMGTKENFWSMGDSGPCGPCSELYFDRGPRFGAARNPAEDPEGNRFIEFWNLVFMEFNRNSSGKMEPLPKKSIDTGAGLERVVSLKIEKESLFETDILRSLIAEIENISGQTYDFCSNLASAFRVIADHIRSLAFAIADGAQPSNTERGYVLRKILRRAVRYGRQIGLNKPFLSHLVPRLIKMMGQDFPELKAAEVKIQENLNLEEEKFLDTLKRGGNLFYQVIDQSKKLGNISGDDAFKLKDTYGFPLEELILLAKDMHLPVDIQRFKELEEEARIRSRTVQKTREQESEEPIFKEYLKKHPPCEFFGYSALTLQSVISGILREGSETASLNVGDTGCILLNQTPFYPEKGGQVGDHGLIVNGHSHFIVNDCQTPYPGIIAHYGYVKEGIIQVGDPVEAIIDSERRQKIANNHTATHLLHWALQEFLGPHVQQAGSVVEPERLRFDYHHHTPLSKKEISLIEDLINQKIRENLPVTCYEVPYSEIENKKEFKQIFSEKYGSTVRVVDIDFSKELCGGTHTSRLGNIGYFRIVKESSISAGVRRIEAATGLEAQALSRQYEEWIHEISGILHVQSKQLGLRIHQILTENQNLHQNFIQLKLKLFTMEAETLMKEMKKLDHAFFLAHANEFNTEELNQYADILMKKQPSLLLVLIGKQKEKCSLLIRVSKELILRKIHANELIKEILPLLNGKGGGKAEKAQGSGTKIENISEVFKIAYQWLERKIT
ncbi:MAG: alanine--tRNA ligase [Chlamydiales bacterium]